MCCKNLALWTMTFTLQLPLFLVLLLTSTGVSGSATQPKSHQHFFQPNLGTALDGIKSSLYGKNNGLQKLFSQVEKNRITMDLLKFKIDKIKNWLIEFYEDPYECDVADTFKFERMCYFLETATTRTFENAQQDCLKRGGTLFQPLDIADADLIAFLKDTLEDGFLSRTNRDVWIGATAVDVEGTIFVNLLNSVELPVVGDGSDFESGTFPDETGNIALNTAVDAGDTRLEFQLYPDDVQELGYICEFMAWIKDPEDIDFKGKDYSAQFLDTGFNHENVENPHDLPTKTCESGQFLVDGKCYSYYARDVPFEDAKANCKDEGGMLAKPNLDPYSRFGAIVADELDDVPADTAIWIHADLGKHGADRISSVRRRFRMEHVSQSDAGSSAMEEDANSTLVNSTLEGGGEEDEHIDSLDVIGEITRSDDSGSDTYVLIIPASTPDNFFDDTDWFIQLVDGSMLLPYLCEFDPVH